MPEGLIIVESPAKARTLKRFLGDRFDVRASMGHVRDLPEKEIAVDVESGFKPRYEVVESRRKTIGELTSAARKDREHVILASDPDREGEAIAWHLAEVLKLPSPKRIVGRAAPGLRPRGRDTQVRPGRVVDDRRRALQGRPGAALPRQAQPPAWRSRRRYGREARGQDPGRG